MLQLRLLLFALFALLSLAPLVVLGAWTPIWPEPGAGTWIAALAACLLASWMLSTAIARHLAPPLKRIVRASRVARETGTPTEVEPSTGWAVSRELREAESGFNDMVRHLRESLAELRRVAFCDSVTGLPNREAFQALTVAEIERLGRSSGAGALLYIDLDDFKAINDTLGHDNGNMVLDHLSRRLAAVVAAAVDREPRDWLRSFEGDLDTAEGTPIVGRVGGDEFSIFVPGLGDGEALGELLKSIKTCLDEPIHFGEEMVVVGASIGAACYPENGETFELLNKRADIAMFHAKRAGKNCFQIYGDEIGDMTVAELRRSVSRGIKNGEFVLFYQPKLRAGMIRVDGVEALIRWQHPSGRLLTPGDFIPMTENSDVIVELGEWVVRAAAADMDELRQSGLETRVSVNISARQFCAPGFASSIARAIEETGIDPSMLELEITEEAILSNIAATRTAIKALQATHVRIALDDFGRGYSNLTRVADLAVDTIKIDGPLTARVTDEDRVQVIIKSTVDMARGLGCETVAEGVETLEQAALLTKLGCTHLQGYYFARPMDLETLKGWIDSQRSSQVGEMQTLIEERMKRIA